MDRRRRSSRACKEVLGRSSRNPKYGSGGASPPGAANVLCSSSGCQTSLRPGGRGGGERAGVSVRGLVSKHRSGGASPPVAWILMAVFLVLKPALRRGKLGGGEDHHYWLLPSSCRAA